MIVLASHQTLKKKRFITTTPNLTLHLPRTYKANDSLSTPSATWIVYFVQSGSLHELLNYILL